MSHEEHTETVPFRKLVEGTDAEYFETEGYDIVDFDWMEGGLEITAVSPVGLAETPESAVALAEGRTPEAAERVREAVEECGLEQKAYDDLDAIAEIADNALAELSTGDLDALEGSIRAIHDRASAWEDPQ